MSIYVYACAWSECVWWTMDMQDDLDGLDDDDDDNDDHNGDDDDRANALHATTST